MDALDAARWLRDATHGITPGAPVAFTYRPLDYAWTAHEAYVRRFGRGPKRALLVGMNPGPWGMGQTGIPFGDGPLVGDWLGLRGANIRVPAGLHPDRPVLGWACTRREASGKRLWGLLRELFVEADAALADLFVVNHCPLLFFDAAGSNITPDKLHKADRETVLRASDDGLRRTIDALLPRFLIGVGAYAEARCRNVAPPGVQVLRIPHPSPASPEANRDGGLPWRAAVIAALETAGVVTAASLDLRSR